MKNYMVYAGNKNETLALVDNITVADDYTVEDYRQDCKDNEDTAPCDWQSEVIEFVEVVE